MKYRDYLIIPAIVMYLLYASCAYIAKNAGDSAVPEAALSPTEITWGSASSGKGEDWYADGIRGTESFSVAGGPGENLICFSGGVKNAGTSSSRYYVSDMHMSCTAGGRSYDLIFLDEMTAYDTISGTYFKRGDYDSMSADFTGGRFVNAANPSDYFVFKTTGKSIEYFGDMAFTGRWRFDTTDAVELHDNRTDKDYVLSLEFDYSGRVSGFLFDGIEYVLTK